MEKIQMVSIPLKNMNKMFKSKEAILVSEERRGEVIKNNAYYFVKWCAENNKLENKIFLVTAQYIDDLPQHYQVIDTSKEHYQIAYATDLVLFTHRIEYAFPKGMIIEDIKKLEFHGWHLQHGVMFFKKIDNFYEQGLNPTHTKRLIAYTDDGKTEMQGYYDQINIAMPRWNFLEPASNTEVRKILVAPTWRREMDAEQFNKNLT